MRIFAAFILLVALAGAQGLPQPSTNSGLTSSLQASTNSGLVASLQASTIDTSFHKSASPKEATPIHYYDIENLENQQWLP